MTDLGPSGDEKRLIRPADAEEMRVLYAEHSSLIAARSLTYSEISSRFSGFLAILSASVIALALIAQAAHFTSTFVGIAILVLTIVLFVGVTTLGRLIALNLENLRWVSGMNRLRRAYLERYPDLEPHFITDSYDDPAGILVSLGFEGVPSRQPRSVFEGLQTMPGTVGVMVAVVAGALLGLIAIGLEAPEVVVVVVVVAAGGTFVLTFTAFAVWGQRAFARHMARLEAHYPRPKKP